MPAMVSSAVLRQILSLAEKREDILKEIEELEKRISKLSSAEVVIPSHPEVKQSRRVPVRRRPVEGKASKRGGTKTKILELLKGAGQQGMSVKEIASKLGMKTQNLHVWFHTTGKKLGTLKKTGRARWASRP